MQNYAPLHAPCEVFRRMTKLRRVAWGEACGFRSDEHVFFASPDETASVARAVAPTPQCAGS
jgi:hypothetical protein